MRFSWPIIILAIAHTAFAQNSLVTGLYKQLADHPQMDTVQVSILNELSTRVLKAKPEESFRLAERALHISQELSFQRGIGEAKNNLAVFHLMRGNADEALDLAFQATKIGEQEHQPIMLANSNAILATIYLDQAAHDKALERLATADQLNKVLRNPMVECKILNTRGSIARDQRKYDSALFYYRKAIEVMRAGQEDYRLPEVLNNIGVVLQRQHQTSLAMEYYYKALAAAEESGNRFAQALTLGNIGHTLVSEKQYEKASRLLLQSIQLSKETGDKKQLSRNYMAMMQLENERGDFNGAHQYMVSYYNLKDSLLNVEKTKQIAELEIRYETEKKELAIQLLERQQRIQQLWTNILLAALTLISALSVIIYLFQKYREKKNRHILYLEIDRLTSQRNELSEKFRSILAGYGGETTESLEQRILRKAIEVVERNLSDPQFGVERMGKEMGMSRTNLHRKLKAITGFPPSELIRSIRLRKAAGMLLSQADSVAQISFAVGFEDQSYFSKSFKKQFGMPPSEYLSSMNEQDSLRSGPDFVGTKSVAEFR